MRRVAAALALMLGPLSPARADEPLLPEVAAALARIEGRSTIELTTIGRKSGKEHTRPVWFAVSEGKILVQAGKNGKTDWYRNLKRNPSVKLRAGEYAFRARVRLVTDPAQVERIHKLFLHKYTTAWLLSFVGSSLGRGLPVELNPVAVAVRR